MRGLFGAASAWGQCAPAAPFRPLRARAMSFVRLECGLAPRPAPTSPLDGVFVRSVLWEVL